MPTYEYACKTCEQHMEVAQSFDEDALTECPKCGGNLRKVYGNIGVSFKGSGFYKTDNRAKSRSGGGHEHHDHASHSGGGGDDHGASSTDVYDKPLPNGRKAPKPEALAKAMTSIPEMARTAAEQATKRK